MNIIFAIAKTTIGEAIRRRILLVILLIGALLLVIAPSLSMLTARQETTVLKSLTLGIIQIVGALIAIVLTIYMLPNEVERRTIYTILSKPVQRWQFLIGKYLGAIGALGLMLAMMTLTLMFVYAVMQSQEKPVAAILTFLASLVCLVALGTKMKDSAGGQVGLAVLSAGLMASLYWIGQETAMISVFADFGKTTMMFFIQLSILAAVGVLFSTFVPPIVNFFLTGGVFFIGSMFNTLFDTVSTNPDIPQGLQIIIKIVQSIIPNFQDFAVQNTTINSVQVIRGEMWHYLNLVGYGVAYIAILLIISILIFDRKEV